MATQDTIRQISHNGQLMDIEDAAARQLIASVQAALDAITSGDTTTAIKTFEEVIAFLDNVEDTDTLQGIIAGLNISIAAKYTKPGTGIPASDLAQAVQILLGKADTALQSHQDISGKANKSEMSVTDGTGANADKTTIQLKNGTSATVLTQHQDISGKQDKLTSSDILLTINGSAAHYGDSITVQGEKGDKGDTGSVQVDGNGNVLIYNGLDKETQGAALDASQGMRLALLSGTYEQAWQRSKVVTGNFAWLWSETIGNDTIKKPIWHVGNSVFVDMVGAIVSAADAVSAPASPTFAANGSSVSDNDYVPKNTQLTITPASGSVLYYRVGSSGSYTASLSAVTIVLSEAGSAVVSAYCKNTQGDSSITTLNLTVEGTPVPQFEAKNGTTIDVNNVVSRGGVVVINGTAGGTLKYKVNSASSYTEVPSVGGAAPSAEVAIGGTGTTTIKAYNIVDGDNSTEITKEYTMVALDAPTMTMSDTTETDNQFPVGGGSVTLNGPSGARIYYTTDGSTPYYTDENDYNGTLYSSAIAVTSQTTIKAIAVDNYGSSNVVENAYSVAVDHKFQFKIRLTGNTVGEGGKDREYIPVESSEGPRYTMTVDWGDGSAVQSFSNQGFYVKGLYHDYAQGTGTGTNSDEFIITLRGSAIPVLSFSNGLRYNKDALIAILDNTLECDTQFIGDTIKRGGFWECTNLASICANALQNNTAQYVTFSKSSLTSVPDGLLSHLTKNGVALLGISDLFHNTAIVLTASQMAELKSSVSSAKEFGSAFYGVSGSLAIPDDFFDAISDGTITSVWGFTHSAGANVTGDAKKLYDALATRITEDTDAVRKFSLGGSGLTNKDQVPTTWGGSMSV